MTRRPRPASASAAWVAPSQPGPQGGRHVGDVGPVGELGGEEGGGHIGRFHQVLASTPEIVEAHHVTGEDCFVLTVRARSMRHPEEVTGRIGGLGAVTTSVVYSSPLPRRSVLAAVPRPPAR